jgi:HEPN domain-containing protein
LTPEEAEEAGRLLEAADADLRAARVLAPDAAQANEVVGFHAQQPVEKAIKAVLVPSGVDIPYTHDLSFLLDIVGQNSIGAPEAVVEADWLTPWAMAARYGASHVSLDRETAVAVAAEAVDWATIAVDRTPLWRVTKGQRVRAAAWGCGRTI